VVIAVAWPGYVDGLVRQLRGPGRSDDTVAEAVDFSAALVAASLSRLTREQSAGTVYQLSGRGQAARQAGPARCPGRHARVAAMHLAFARDQVGSTRPAPAPYERMPEVLLTDAIRLVSAAREAIRRGGLPAESPAVARLRSRARVHLHAAQQALGRELADHAQASQGARSALVLTAQSVPPSVLSA
jgi:hypothetical protein